MKKQTGQFSNFSTQRRLLWLSLCFIFLLFGCEEGTISIDENVAGPKTITIFVDGTSRSVTSEAGTVRQLLQEEAITVGDTDEVTPPLFTPLTGLESITIVRVNQSLEVIEESVPFGREFIRSDSMGTEDPARIIQGGRPGLQEVTVRIIFRDGVETERQIVNVNVIEEAVNEIVMIGTGVAAGNVLFAGTLAYISGGRGILLRGATAFPEQLDLGGIPDSRVFELSPTGEFLLYSLAESEGSFNSLWVLPTLPGAEPIPLGVSNVLWAGWEPSAIQIPLIAYTT
ncbi:MAG: G5 domain-containing protein, partial [Anaerolineales bacterium]|nr:G5 domain-containing protein [Anaerolineales bacterium]